MTLVVAGFLVVAEITSIDNTHLLEPDDKQTILLFKRPRDHETTTLQVLTSPQDHPALIKRELITQVRVLQYNQINTV